MTLMMMIIVVIFIIIISIIIIFCGKVRKLKPEGKAERPVGEGH